MERSSSPDRATLPGRGIGSAGLSVWLRRGLLLSVGLLVLGWLVGSGIAGRLLRGEISPEQLWAQFNSVTTIFLGIFIEAGAFLLLGVLMSAIIQVFITADTIRRWVPRNRFGSTLVGASLGFFIPVCECGSIPAARRLMQKGAPVSMGVAFLLAAPVINPIVLISTWVAFDGDPWVVGGRFGLTLLIAGLVAIIFALHPAPRSWLAPAPATAAAACCAPGEELPRGWRNKLRAIVSHSSSEFFEMGQYLVLGAFLAALAQTVVPQEWLVQIGSNPISSVLVMMALAVMLSICSTVDAFIALGFAGTFNTGSILAFLVFGPMIDIKATLLFMTTFRRRGVFLLLLLVTLLSFLTSLWINYNV